jgi:succinoglycan biosynthesis protein ExoM
MGIVSSFCGQGPVDIAYICEPDQNISLARNRAVRNARGNYLALIDDDECPGEDWLWNMYNTIKEHNSDGVLGPVDPQYAVKPPKWILKGRLHGRKKFKTGEILRDPRDARTGMSSSRKIFSRAQRTRSIPDMAGPAERTRISSDG